MRASDFAKNIADALHLIKDEDDTEARSHLALLHDVLSKELHDNLRALDDYILNGVITYSTVWMLFEPGELVFGYRDGQPAVARLNEGQYTSNRCGEYYALACHMVDCMLTLSLLV